MSGVLHPSSHLRPRTFYMTGIISFYLFTNGETETRKATRLAQDYTTELVFNLEVHCHVLTIVLGGSVLIMI